VTVKHSGYDGLGNLKHAQYLRERADLTWEDVIRAHKEEKEVKGGGGRISKEDGSRTTEK